MLGRQVAAALRRPLHAPLPTTAAPQARFALAIRTFSHAPRLLEDTAERPKNKGGRPRKAVGEPSRPVKRAVKKAAKKPAAPTDEAAVARIAEKKRIAKEKLAAANAKQKKLAAAEKKKAKDAAMTPEQLARKRAVLVRAEIRDLRKAALDPPFPNTVGPWSAFLREKSKGRKVNDGSSTPPSHSDVKSTLAERARKLAAAYKELSAGELEHYNHISRVEREEAAAAFKRWVESHSREEIKLANSARKALRNRKDRKLPPRATRRIEDERVPKKALTAYFLFTQIRQLSGDFKNIQVTERAKLIGQEWKALSEDEKVKYNKLAEQDKQRYEAEKAAMNA